MTAICQGDGKTWSITGRDSSFGRIHVDNRFQQTLLAITGTKPYFFDIVLKFVLVNAG